MDHLSTLPPASFANIKQNKITDFYPMLIYPILAAGMPFALTPQSSVFKPGAPRNRRQQNLGPRRSYRITPQL